MDSVYLTTQHPMIVGVRVVDSINPAQNSEPDMKSLEQKRQQLIEENKRLRAILAETPHKRIQYKIVQQTKEVLERLLRYRRIDVPFDQILFASDLQ